MVITSKQPRPPAGHRRALLTAWILAPPLLLACGSTPPAGGSGGTDAGGDGTADTTAPTVTITSAATSTTRDYLLTGEVSDDVGVVALDVMVDQGEPVPADLASPFQVALQLDAGSHDVRVEARDAAGNVGSDQITVVVTLPDRAPVAADQSVTLDEDTDTDFSLDASDPDGDALSVVLVDPPDHGTLDLGDGLAVTYHPAADYHGADAFDYRASDGSLESEVASVSLTIHAVNDAPVAHPQSVVLDEDDSLAIQLLADDADGDLLSYVVIEPPTHGSLAPGAFRTFVYTPDANYFGADAFRFQVSDGIAQSDALVSIEVRAVNDPPTITVPETPVHTDEDTPVDLALSGTDVETAAQSLTFVVAVEPQHGSVSILGHTATYTPALDYNGTDVVSFASSDGDAQSDPVQVGIVVDPVNDAPVAVDADLSTREDTPLSLTLGATDVDNPPEDLVFEVLEAPSTQAGTLEGTPPDLTFVPSTDFHGGAELTFQVSDGELSDTGTVTLTVLEGTYFYVDRTTGDDGQSGLFADEALRTLGEAVSRADVPAADELPDVVFISAGRYCEQDVAIDRSLQIVGAGIDDTILDGSNHSLNCVATVLPDCTVRAASSDSGPVLDVARPASDGAQIHVSISDLTITGANHKGALGGGVSNQEDLELLRVRLADNCAWYGGGLANQAADDGSLGSALLTDCEVIGNAAYAVSGDSAGGGLYNVGTMDLDRTAVSGNTAGSSGGGIDTEGVVDPVEAGRLTLVDSPVTDNESGLGGGLYIQNADADLTNSDVARNQGAGIPGLAGGGVMVTHSTGQRSSLSLSGGVIESNAASFGGGLYADGADLTLDGTVIQENRGGMGGGAWLRDVGTVVGLIVQANDAHFYGGGLYVEGPAYVGLNDLVAADNTATLGGGVYTNSATNLLRAALSGNRATRAGGGLYAAAPSTFLDVQLNECLFVDNVAQGTPDGCDAGVLPCDPGSLPVEQMGGGIAVRDADMTLGINDTTFSGNVSADSGGAVGLEAGDLYGQNNRFLGNRATSGGDPDEQADGFLPRGGALALRATAVGIGLDYCEFEDNQADWRGGAIDVEGLPSFGTTGSAFLRNIAGDDEDDGAGGAFYILNTPVVTAFNTYEGNRATGSGAVYQVDEDAPDEAGLTIIQCTITANGAAGEAPAAVQGEATMSSVGTIFAFNLPQSCDAGNPVSGEANNLDMDGSCGLPEDQLTGVDPRLQPVGDYGGQTLSRLPSPGSPVIDAEAECSGDPADQRGVHRPQDGDGVGGALCDIGSVEVAHP